MRNADLAKSSTNVMDRWITASLHGLIKFVREEMEAYRLYTVVPRLLSLIERLTNWYVRFNRLRLKGDTGAEDQLTCLSVLYEVLYSLCLLMAPFMPFITEYMYQNLKKAIPAGTFAAEQAAAGGESKGDDGVVVVANAHVDGVVGDESVHYMDLPNFDASVIDEEAEETMEYLTQVIVLGRAVRQRRNRPTKTAFKNVTVVHKDAAVRARIEQLADYVKAELNALSLTTEAPGAVGGNMKISVVPDRRALGRRLGKAFGKPLQVRL